MDCKRGVDNFVRAALISTSGPKARHVKAQDDASLRAEAWVRVGKEPVEACKAHVGIGAKTLCTGS